MTTETQTEPLPLREEDTVLIANLYDLDANFDKVFSHYVLPWDADVALRDHTVATALYGFKWKGVSILIPPDPTSRRRTSSTPRQFGSSHVQAGR